MMNRHDLLFLSEEGIHSILSHSQEWGMDQSLLKIYFSNDSNIIPIPVIYKQQWEMREGFVECGVSFPFFEGNVRCRRTTWVDLNHIKKTMIPYDIISFVENLPPKQQKVWKVFQNYTRKYQLELGVFGSTALQMITGRPYLHEDSDMDFIVKGKLPQEQLKQFFEEYQSIKASVEISIDTEYFLDDCGSVKLEEMGRNLETVLIKSNKEPFLMSCQDALLKIIK